MRDIELCWWWQIRHLCLLVNTLIRSSSFLHCGLLISGGSCPSD
jgi:hypothetical protein